MGTLWQDVRYGFRMLLQRPGFALTAAVVLALGIGANTALFSVIYTVLLSPLPFPDADRIMFLELEWRNGLRSGTSSGPDYLDWTARNTVFESMCAIEYYRSGLALTGAGEPLALKGLRATSSFFPTVQPRMTLGRCLSSPRLGHSHCRPNGPGPDLVDRRGPAHQELRENPAIPAGLQCQGASGSARGAPQYQ